MSLRVLVVDDEPHVTQVLKTFLARAGFIVDVAANGKDGLLSCSKNPPDAVITDFEMPEMDGRELIDTLVAQDEDFPRLIILVTSRTDADLREWVDGQNRVEFVEKPASPRRLVQFVETQLKNSQNKACA